MKGTISLVALGLLFAGGAAAQSKCVEPACSTQVAKVLYPASLPIVIRKAGLYVLDRSWTIAEEKDAPLIEIRADNAILDLRGYTIDYRVTVAPDVIEVTGDGVTVRNGRLWAGSGDVEAPALIGGPGVRTTIDHMDISGPASPVALNGYGTRILDSDIGSRTDTLLLPSSFTMERTRVSCAFQCLEMNGNSQIIDSEITGAQPLEINGNGNQLLRTRVSGRTELTGNWNVLRDNVLGGADGGGVVVNGTGNVIDANIVPRDREGEIIGDGIRFLVDGNFYGDNRVAASVPFDLGSTVQTDWGGNVGF